MSVVSTRRRAERGYNLVEVLVAMALLGVVTISVMTLFFMARGNVYSGKQMTNAVAVGTQVMEDLSGKTLQDVYDSFRINAANTPAVGNFTIDGVTYNNAFIRSTSSTVVASAPASISLQQPISPATTGGLLTNWQALLSNMTDGSVTLIMTPTTPTTPLLNAAGFARAGILQNRVIVRWREGGGRQRSAVFDTVKTQRG